MNSQQNIIADSKLLRWMIRYAFGDKFNATLFGGDCCRYEIEQSYLTTHEHTQQDSLFNLCKDHEAADLLLLTGPIAKAQVPRLLQIYDEMSQPKWVLAVGSCAMTGGYLSQSPLVETCISDYLPIDIVVSGCPVRPDDFLKGLMKLQKMIKNGELPRGLQ
jgi:NADH-quinone oxidoreductase subunit B